MKTYVKTKRVLAILVAVLILLVSSSTPIPAYHTPDSGTFVSTIPDKGGNDFDLTAYGDTFHTTTPTRSGKGEDSFADPLYYNKIAPLTHWNDEYCEPFCGYWHTTTVNSCEYLTDPVTGAPLYALTTKDSLGNDNGWSIQMVDNHPQRHPNDIGSKAFKMTNPNSSGVNLSFSAFSANSVCLADFAYMRMSIWVENATISTNGGYVQFRAKGEEHSLYTYFKTGKNTDLLLDSNDFNSFFGNETRFDILINLSDYNSANLYNEFGFEICGIKSKSGSGNFSIFVDNIRLIKNTTHTEAYQYTPSPQRATFNDCELTEGTTAGTRIRSAYTTVLSGTYYGRVSYSGDSGSRKNGDYSARMVPSATSYNNAVKYGIVFNNSNWEINPGQSGYDYFKMYFHLGDNVKKHLTDSTKMDIWFLPAVSESEPDSDTVANISTTNGKKKTITLNNYLMQDSWYSLSISCNDVNFVVKAIYLDFGTITVDNPGTIQNSAYFHFDYLHFDSYSQSTQSTTYTYLPGTYKILQDFETTPDASSNVKNGGVGLAMRYEDVQTNPYYDNTINTRLKTADGTNVSIPTGHGENTTEVYCDESVSAVTQGKYAYWFKPENNGSAYFDYYITDDGTANGNPVDLSQFTHFSLDMTIRNPQQRGSTTNTGSYDEPSGLTGSLEQFQITLEDSNGKTANLRFTVQRNGSTDAFIDSAQWGVEGLPLEGFVPGFADSGTTHQLSYTPTGTMRLTFDLGEVMKHRADATAFDITKIKTFRMYYRVKDTNMGDPADGSTDPRNAEFCFDNLVAFTPDMTINVKNTASGADANQYMHYTLIGTDGVTKDINMEFSIAPGQTQSIIQVPLNGYCITQTDWSWRYNKTGWEITVEKLNTSTEWVAGQTYKTKGYKAIAGNQSLREVTVYFSNNTVNDNKWLNGQDFSLVRM